MPTVTQGAIYGDMSRLWHQDLHDLIDHDGAMHARWCFARCHDLGDGLAVFFRIVLLVFLLETPGVLTGIAGTPPMGFGRFLRSGSR